MFNRRHYGFTLIEMVIAIVIISIGLAGVLMAFNTTVRSSADPLIHKQMLAIAEEMMEEILLKPYAPAPGTSGTISAGSCNRASADDVSDYASYTDRPVCDIDGRAVGGLGSYTVSAAIDPAASLGSLSSNVKKVTVTVKNGGESLILVGWRTDYAS